MCIFASNNKFLIGMNVTEKSPISMNTWGLSSKIFTSLHKDYALFMEIYGISPKTHYTIPIFINRSLRNGMQVISVDTASHRLND